MRVAYIVSRFPKLTETFVLYELIALEAMGGGVEVDLYPLLRERQPVAHPEAERWTLRARFHPFVSIRILRAQLHYLVRRPLAYMALLPELLWRTWGSLNFMAGAVAYFPKAVRFAYEMERDGVRHVHAHFCNHPAMVAFIVNRLAGIPYSFTAHGSDLHVERRMLDAKVEASAFAVTISRFNREVMLESCGAQAADRIHIVRCGVDLDAFTVGDRIPAGPCRILCVASFEEVKGHRHLLAACSILKERGVDFICDLAGEGPLRGEMEAMIVSYGLSERVRVLGGQPRPEVIRLFQEADIAVLPSQPTRQGKREGIPVVLMEAMASGLPVVSTVLSGIPELVADGQTGLLVQPADPLALADALDRLASDPELRSRMGAAGRLKVEAEYDLHRNTATLVQLILGKDPGMRP